MSCDIFTMYEYEIVLSYEAMKRRAENQGVLMTVLQQEG